MRSSAFLCLCLWLLLGPRPVRTQDVNVQHPPEIHSPGQMSPLEAAKARMNNAQLQKDAKELSDLCASIPSQMEDLKKGLLAKDLAEKLKRIEKLSKHVREELAP